MSYRSDQFDYMSLDDFEELLADKPRDERWELIDGRVVKLMVGARWEHHMLIQNLAFGLRRRLQDKSSDCRVFTETFYLKSRAVDSATLPDIIVRCGPLQPGATSLDDPTVLVEVMSDGSVGRDRIEKWRVYRKFASLRHYVLIERDKPVVEVFSRVGEMWASQEVLEGADAVLTLHALDLAIPLAEIYRDVLPL